MTNAASEQPAFRFSLRSLFIVITAVIAGIVVSQLGPAGRTPMIIPWIVLIAPSFTVAVVLAIATGAEGSQIWQGIFALLSGLLFGTYALFVVVRHLRWMLLFALILHAVSIATAFVLMMVNC